MQHVGIDIIEIARIERAIARWGNSFLKRVYTTSELALYHGKSSSLAARFSAKEAVIKALNSRRISLKEIEILTTTDGRPRLKLYGRARQKARRLQLINLAISLSHSRDYAIACAIGETNS